MLVTDTFIVKENGKVVIKEFAVYSNCEIPDDTEIDFLSKDEIVEDLESRLNTEDKKLVIDAHDVIALQETIGRYIRNEYGLWLRPHPYSNNSNLHADNFADNISLEILQMLQNRMRK